MNALATRFDELAPGYDRALWLAERLLLRRLRRRLLAGLSGRVLEIGVGTGANLALYPPEVELWAVDVSGEMLARAQARAEALGRRVILNAMDAAELAFPAASFDAVVSTLTLCSPPAPAAVLAEIARVCRPGGTLRLMEHGRTRLGWVNRWLDRIAARHRESWACHPNRDMERLVRGVLEVERVEAHLGGGLKLFWARGRP